MAMSTAPSAYSAHLTPTGHGCPACWLVLHLQLQLKYAPARCIATQGSSPASQARLDLELKSSRPHAQGPSSPRAQQP